MTRDVTNSPRPSTPSRIDGRSTPPGNDPSRTATPSSPRPAEPHARTVGSGGPPSNPAPSQGASLGASSLQRPRGASVHSLDKLFGGLRVGDSSPERQVTPTTPENVFFEKLGGSVQTAVGEMLAKRTPLTPAGPSEAACPARKAVLAHEARLRGTAEAPAPIQRGSVNMAALLSKLPIQGGTIPEVIGNAVKMVETMKAEHEAAVTQAVIAHRIQFDKANRAVLAGISERREVEQLRYKGEIDQLKGQAQAIAFRQSAARIRGDNPPPTAEQKAEMDRVLSKPTRMEQELLDEFKKETGLSPADIRPADFLEVRALWEKIETEQARNEKAIAGFDEESLAATRKHDDQIKAYTRRHTEMQLDPETKVHVDEHMQSHMPKTFEALVGLEKQTRELLRQLDGVAFSEMEPRSYHEIRERLSRVLEFTKSLAIDKARLDPGSKAFKLLEAASDNANQILAKMYLAYTAPQATGTAPPDVDPAAVNFFREYFAGHPEALGKFVMEMHDGSDLDLEPLFPGRQPGTPNLGSGASAQLMPWMKALYGNLGNDQYQASLDRMAEAEKA